jgi:hypothetical protein
VRGCLNGPATSAVGATCERRLESRTDGHGERRGYVTFQAIRFVLTWVRLRRIELKARFSEGWLLSLDDVTTYAVSNLLSAALKPPRLCIVISNLSGAYEGASREITAMVAKATRDFQNETGRQAKGITPVEPGSDEIYSMRTRMLAGEPNSRVVDSVATAFFRRDFLRRQIEDGRQVDDPDRRGDRRELSLPPVVQANSGAA